MQAQLATLFASNEAQDELYAKTRLSATEEKEWLSMEQQVAQEYFKLTAQHQQSSALLKSVLSDGQRGIGSLIQETEGLHAKHLSLEDDILDFKSRLTMTLDAPLTTEGESSTSKTLHKQIQNLHSRISNLEAAQAYLLLLDRAEKLSIEALKAVESNNLSACLDSYRSLIEYQKSLKGKSPAMESIEFIERLAEETFASIRNTLNSRLEKCLDQLGWPAKNDEILSQIDTRQGQQLEQSFLDLLALQKTREEALPEEDRFHLLPIETLVNPLYLRFRYHFEGVRQTNRLDKPEWYFAHVLNLISLHARFVQVLVQAFLKEGGYPHISALSQFISLLLVFVERRLRETVPQLLDLPPILAHTIFQALQFDEEIKEKYSYSDQGVEGDWKGTADVILGNTAWFDGWRNAEKKYVEDRYYEIISAPDAWQINRDYSESSLKPTDSAIRIKDLFDLITSRYKPLPLFSYRLAFLLSIQVPLLEAYLSRLTSAVDAIDSHQSSILRAVPGAMGDGGRHAGVAALQRLSRVLLTSKWMSEMLQKCSDDLFFMDLNEDFQTLSEDDLNDDSRKAFLLLKGSLPQKSLFSNIIDAFDALSSRVEDLMVRHVHRTVTGELKAYLARSWDYAASVDNPNASLGLSSEITGALTLYSALLGIISDTFPFPLVQKYYRQIGTMLSDYLYTRVATAKVFSEHGGKQFLEDIVYGWEEAAREKGIRRPAGPLSKMKSAAILLAIPAEVEDKSQIKFADAVSATWNAEPVYREMLARSDLQGCDLLQKDAQTVLKKRPECWQTG